MDRKELKDILDQHKLWVDSEAKEGRQAYLDGADLCDTSFYGVNLRRAYLEGVKLRGASLRGADLEGANLRSADLYAAILCGANLRTADLIRASLYCADLRGASLQDADLRGANLQGADITGADLKGADLYGVNLCGAKGVLQWQSPQGENRICYSVKHEDCVMHQLGCFWGNTQESVEAIRKKYGENSLYEKFLLMQAEALEQE